MFDKVRKPWRAKNYNMKSIVSVVLFGAIIVVFALFGIVNPDRSMGAGGGTAAIVNDTGITVAEWKRGVEINSRNSGYPLDKMPSEQREQFLKSIQSQTLNQMVLTEIAYQAAAKYGIGASNGQVRDLLLTAPIFQEGGRFVRDRYETYLNQIGQSSDEFERGLRKQLVLQRVEELFSTASMPTASEVAQLTELKSAQANIRYVDLSPGKLQADKAVTDKEVAAYIHDPAKQELLKKYYDEHSLDFQLPERVHARDILLRIDDKHSEKDVSEQAKALHANLTAANFAATAEKESQDMRTAKKGGDLGFFERGHIDAHIESVAFGLKPGSISAPIKLDGVGYILVYVEEHSQPRTIGKEEAYPKIAKTLIAQANAPVALGAIKKALDAGSTAETDAALKKYGMEWEKPVDVNLGEPQIAQLSDPEPILKALAAHSGKTGLIRQLVGAGEHQYAVNIVGWKKNDKAPAGKDDLQKTLAMQTSEDSFQEWVRVAKSKASVTLNQKLIER